MVSKRDIIFDNSTMEFSHEPLEATNSRGIYSRSGIDFTEMYDGDGNTLETVSEEYEKELMETIERWFL